MIIIVTSFVYSMSVLVGLDSTLAGWLQQPWHRILFIIEGHTGNKTNKGQNCTGSDQSKEGDACDCSLLVI